jgi:hypothetical protein
MFFVRGARLWRNDRLSLRVGHPEKPARLNYGAAEVCWTMIRSTCFRSVFSVVSNVEVAAMRRHEK